MLGARYSCKILNKIDLSRQVFKNKNSPLSNFMKILSVVAELFHVDGRTDRRDEATGNCRFSRFCEPVYK